MARCAVCRVELVNGRDKVKLEREFVVHAQCVGGVPQVEHELEVARRDLAQKVAKHERDAHGLRTMLDRAENQERITHLAHDAVARELAMVQAELAEERVRRADAEFKLEVLRNAPAKTEAIPDPDKKDRSENRFELLELT